MVRSGYDSAFPQFTSVNLHWTSSTLDGDVYAEPLVVGTVVLLATENNSLYELNATNGQTVWRRNFGLPVNGASLPCGDINPSGITSTPVIDVVTRTIFTVAFLQNPSLHHELFGVNLDTGSIDFQLPIDPSGANPTIEQQRAALALANGYVYVAYGGLDGDCGQYHGWIAATNENGNGPVVSFQVPTGRAGAIWGGGDGPVVDSSGDLLLTTGNSDSTSTFDFGDSVMKLSSASRPPINIVDWFAPADWAALNSADLDLGSTEPVVLDANHLFQIGKDGVGYVLNATNLGHVGGQLYSAQVCSGGGAYGGPAYAAPYLIVPCTSGLAALNVDVASATPFTVAWRSSNFVTGPPIIAGGAVWDVDVSDGQINALSLTSGQTLFHDTLGSLPTHFNSLSAAYGQVFVSSNRQIRAYLPQTASMNLVTSVASGSGSVTPNCPAPNGCTEQVESPVSVAATATTGYVFAGWTLGGASCSAGPSLSPCQFTMPGNPVTVSASFRQLTSLTLSASPTSLSVGGSVTLSGAITPNPGTVSVSLSLSLDSGNTWSFLLSVDTDTSGRYSTTWKPPTSGAMLLRSSWNGNSEFAGSQSSTAHITITGSAAPTPTVLLFAPTTAAHGETVILTISVFNPASTSLNANITLQITGPNNYNTFEVMPVNVAANSHSTVYYDWATPTQTGTYVATVSLLPPTQSGLDTETIQVT